MMIDTQPLHPDVKEVGKAVVIAAIGALLAGLINWGVDELKAEIARRREGHS